MLELRYHESKQRGSLDFPLDYHYVDRRHPRYAMPYHWHEEVEILHVLEGSFPLMIGDTLCSLQKGDVACIAPGSLHGGQPASCVYECVVFDMRLLLKTSDHLKPYIADIISGRILVSPHLLAGSSATAHTILPMFEALRKQSEGAALITLGCLFQFVGQVYQHANYTRHAAMAGVQPRRVLQLKKVFEMIETQYPEPLSLGLLSQAVNMTPKYFCRFFKQATHRTPMDYLGYYRMEMACHAIVSTDKNVTEVALEVGFQDVNYFIRSFKKYKGMTPKQYMLAMRPAK